MDSSSLFDLFLRDKSVGLHVLRSRSSPCWTHHLASVIARHTAFRFGLDRMHTLILLRHLDLIPFLLFHIGILWLHLLVLFKRLHRYFRMSLKGLLLSLQLAFFSPELEKGGFLDFISLPSLLHHSVHVVKQELEVQVVVLEQSVA